MPLQVIGAEVVNELCALQLDCVTIGGSDCSQDQNDLALHNIRRSIKRLRALMPDDPDLTEGVDPNEVVDLLTFLIELERWFDSAADQGYLSSARVDSRSLERLRHYLAAFMPRPSQQETGKAAVSSPEIDGIPDPQPPAPDGPALPDGFSWKGKTYHGLTDKPFRVVKYLWSCPNRAATYQDFAEPVYDDHEKDLIPDTAIGGFRREINTFFRDNEIPFHAAQVNGCLALRDGLPPSAKPAANRRKPASKKRGRK
jgi:hypothetical protein